MFFSHVLTNMYFMNLLSLLTLTDLTVFLDTIKNKNINDAIVYHCSHSEEVIDMQKLFNKHNVRITAPRIDNNVSPKIPFMYHRMAIIVNASCENWAAALNIFDPYFFFKNSFVWLILTEDLNSTINTLSNHPIEVDSDMTVIHKHQDIFNFYEIYNTGLFKKHGKFQTIYVGFWNSTLHVERRSRFNLGGIVLKVPVVVTEDITQTLEKYLTTVEAGEVDFMNKRKFFSLLTFLQSMFNITYELQRTNSWGYPINDSFNGIIGALHRQDADIGGSPLFFRADRVKCSDYVAQVWETRPCFHFRHPKNPGGYSTIFIRPLTSKVWLCILISMATSAAILALMLRLRMLNVSGDDEDSSASLACLFIWSAICQQGMSISRGSSAVKVVMFVIFAFSVTLYQYYNATVVSTLLHDAPKNIRSLRDLVKSDLKAGIEDVLYNKDYLERMKDIDPVINRLYYKKISTLRGSNYFSPEKGMAMVKRGGFAFHLEANIAYRLIKDTFSEREVCELQEVQMYPPQKMGVVARKGTPYKEYVAYGIRKMAESGIMHRLKLAWDEPRPPCVNTPDSSVFSVTIQEFSTALIILVFGMAASMLILLCEILVYGKQKRLVDFRH